MLDGLRKRVDRARLFARAIRSTHVVQPVRPAGLVEFLKGASKVPPGIHLAVMFHAAAHPDKEALVEYGADGVQRMTWGELDATINRLANALVARGATGGTRVALMLPNGAEYLIAHQALARLRATAIQIGYHLKAAEIAHILSNAEPSVTLVHAEQLDAIMAARALTGQAGPIIVVGDPGNGAPTRTAPELIEWDRALAAGSPEVPAHVPRGDGGGVIVYTSGTTGKSKGAHRGWTTMGLESIADLVHQVGVRADDRHLVVCPLYHSAAPAFVAMMLALGGTVVLMNHFEPAGALDIIERERVTCTLMVPTMIVRIANLPPETLASRDTSTLRWVMSVAAPLATEAARRFMDRFGEVLWNFYGSTETGMVTLAGPGDHVTYPGTIGRALRGNDIRLLDDAGGYYYLESRKHDMVISGGVNIYPREIEDHLLAHPAILDAAVIGVPDPEWGESLRAFVVLREGHPLSEAEVIAYCRDGLAGFKRPRRVTFVSELPRNPTGKVLKRMLREQP